MSMCSALKIALVAVSVGWSTFNYADENTLEFSKADVHKVVTSDLTQIVTLNGTLQPLHMVNVNAQVDGEIEEVLVREGDQVKKGQVLARFATVELTAHLNERLASLDGAKAQQALAEKNFDKVKNLFGKKYISQTDFDTAQNQLTIAQANTKAAESGVELARKSLSDAVVKAPQDGIVSERLAQPGQRTAMHVRLFVIVNLKELEFTGSVPSSDIPLVRAGQTATFAVDGFVNRVFTATVSRINPMAVPGARSYLIYLRVLNEDQALRGGMLAKGALVVDTRKNALSVPSSALREREQGGKYLYLIEGDTLVERSVETGLTDTATGYIEITQGVTDGTIVLNNRAKVEPGRKVMLLNN